jgi:hypothetical protein
LNTLYYDFPQGYTLFIANSSGLTENNITPVPIVKEEILIGMDVTVYSKSRGDSNNNNDQFIS